ncbi:Glucosidase YgjK [Bacteroides pyogenes]|uniref:MGH1-like glycoside hydrolase domain-containing protein n=1 Tax=Bacteroides pyogenes TaxID=310300 RepID=UPI0011E4AC99|nr:trehalase family glycosidase [Bacteroides pyogenes]MBR8720452.1 Glucosidase YgjK [Bacteroides pyogenes]MBR8725244.1 Glucosidase YgjK [Bacteroides pyogenes]MBR8738713.1 Glucosidase YgjK [Bacteroides pyogenes]MBR8754481.1 Glucosidase YgjK [Bacteroides pyogenes]MBR8787237.1 Glucosidase YgjK [Bacteroides pyogenes]
MKHRITYIIASLWLVFGIAACHSGNENTSQKRYEFADIFDIAYTPDTLHACRGWFTDAGSWMGFTLPEKEQWVNGFCGPFSLDMFRRQWMAQSVVTVCFSEDVTKPFTPDSTCYFPGELYLSAHSELGHVAQRLNFVDASTALLRVEAEHARKMSFTATGWGKDITVSVEQNSVIARHVDGERVTVTFTPEVFLEKHGNNYVAKTVAEETIVNVAISFFPSEKEMMSGLQNLAVLLNRPEEALRANAERWEGYMKKVLREDMKPEYDRIAVKALTTLISNWRTHRGGLLHEGIVPSHAVGYFVGFWAWDSWRFSAGTAKFHPELAKNNIRAMFDYQQSDGMIVDCIYTDPSENNNRDSKPPLVCWAVDEIFTHTGDTAFIAEMYPQLLSYYKWWYWKRDHDGNGMCEYGSTDGTLEAAAWESGMDNAIRFDNVVMLKNRGEEDAWSMDQESVDLNAYLALECRLLKKFAGMLGAPFDAPDYGDRVAEYFFDKEHGFFFDRRLKDGSFVREPGCEAYTPLWTEVATHEQVSDMLPVLRDTAKFSTYIPFPTIAADHPKYDPKGYWRGPIWLDQTYFAIRGLRNYGYKEWADEYTLQVFDRLNGLKEKAPIHENYGTHTGERLKAPHFSWSASHLLMLYEDYGK